MNQKLLNAIVIERVEVTPELIILRVKPNEGEIPPFKAGQFAILGLPPAAARIELSDTEEEEEIKGRKAPLIRRAYSIASASNQNEYLEFYITLVRSGELTPRLFHLRRGDELFLGKKITGMFTLDQIPTESNLVFVATGTGLAPYMSMIRTMLPLHPNRRVAIVHGARHSWDLGYISELYHLSSHYDNFHYLPIISRPKIEPLPWHGATGYVQDIWKSGRWQKVWGADLQPKKDHLFLCGNPVMIEMMVEMLTGAGLSEGKDGEIHCERYW
jgi:ferredoxin/flavodoxin---NADP+ reductase